MRAGKVPKLAIVNGLYKGPVPPEISILNFVEMSMISLYSTITKIGIQGGKHSIKLSSVYTIINNTATIAKSLPVMPTLDSIALLRHYSAGQNKDWNYRPGRVRAALIWLKENNALYKDIIISYPEGFGMSKSPVNCIHFELDDDEIEAMSTNEEGSSVPSTNTGAPDVIESLLTVADDSIISNCEAVRIALTSDGNPTPIMERETSADFVNSYHNSLYFWEKCFPNIFPYGHGGPSDPIRISVRTDMPTFHKYQLRQSSEADGRRCQMTANYIFSAYESEMKRKIGSVSLAAANDDAHGVVEPIDNNVTNEQLQALREFVNIPPPCVQPGVSLEPQPPANVLLTNKEADETIKKLLSRLVPYSKPLNGTALHRAGEKKKFLGLLTSPVSINSTSLSYRTEYR